eukprot:sb/3477308/
MFFLTQDQFHHCNIFPNSTSIPRCLEIRESVFDPVMVRAARAAGISLEDLRSQLPDSFFLWMDPYEGDYIINVFFIIVDDLPILVTTHVSLGHVSVANYHAFVAFFITF